MFIISSPGMPQNVVNEDAIEAAIILMKHAIVDNIKVDVQESKEQEVIKYNYLKEYLDFDKLKYFDNEYIKCERILWTAQMFQVIHTR